MKKMKKMMLGVLTCLMLLGAVGCGGKPSGMDSTLYEVGCKVAEVSQAYLDAELTVEEAQDKIKMLQSRIEKKYEDSTDDLVALKINRIKIEFNALEAGVDSAKDLEKVMTELKGLLSI